MIAFALVLAQVRDELVADVVEMDAFSWVFMLVSMGAVITLTAWCYTRILRTRKHFDPDGTGPASPPISGRVDEP